MVESTTGVGSKLADMAKKRAKSIEEEKAKQTQELMHQSGSSPIRVLAKAGNSDDNLRAPVPTRRHSSEWRQWVAGIVFSIVIPSCTAKIGTIVTLMKNIGNVVETLETIAEMVECTAFVVGKLADMGKKGAESNEDLPTPAEEKAKQTQELVQQEGEFGNGVGQMIECSSQDDTENRQETGLVKRFP
ncbi:hypothetical protein DCAR_0103675 [Daucus carota subsp. sativus]|uniref:Uncharacterized protein n=1 Tax=Daucus carota subsp. sativus TaxID=79200 RepID=A0A166I6S9_DAUCS|nr:hypothetical protein DCAR_0103675 [Daucus carota subsp. sativus]